MVLLMGGLLLGASRCERTPTGGGGGDSEGEGSSGPGSGQGEGNGDDGNGDDGSGDGSGGGEGVPCGPTVCASGEVCCNASCGICTEPDGFCTQQLCTDAGPPDDGEGERCGDVTCPSGHVCCNASCGICTEPGDSCTQQFCGDDEVPEGERCGDVTCPSGQVCCNASCGICTERGGFCTLQICDEPEPDPDPEYGPFCGGIAGFGCPGAGECVDDPRDDCDPEKGGADCGGVCQCTAGPTVLCEQGTVWNASPEVCACEPVGGGGETCGKTTCPEGQVCCNASCGICTPPGFACIQIACL